MGIYGFEQIGGVSLYLWLTHRILLYEPLRTWMLSLKLPVLIITTSFIIMIPIAIILRKIDSLLKAAIRKKKENGTV